MLCTGAAFAQAPTDKTRSLEAEVLAAVVTVGVRAVPHARTASHLGSERQGSGVILDAAGHVATSAALVQEADSILVTTADGRTVQAAVAFADETEGVALLRPAAALGVRPLPLGSSTALAAMGNGLVAAAAKGRAVAMVSVVALDEYAGEREILIEGALLATPALPDYAGAALVDGTGKLGGVGALKVAAVPGRGAAGNVFIPVERFHLPLAGVQRGDSGPPRRAWIGLVLAKGPLSLAIAEVPADSPAARAGLHVGDEITAVNGEPIASRAALYRRLWRERPGAEISLTVRRDGTVREVRVRAIDAKDYQIQRAHLLGRRAFASLSAQRAA